MPWPSPVSWALALVVAAQVAKRTPRPPFAVLGSAMAVTALVLYAVTPRGVIDLSIGLVLGIGVGLVLPAARLGDRRVLVLLGLGGLSAVVSLRATALVVVVAAVMNIASNRARAKAGRHSVTIVAAGSVLSMGLVLW